jgi:hypothetical protein
MSNVYGVAFSGTNPSSYPSLAPTFITFKKMSDGSDVTPPTIAQVSTTGIYSFTFTPSFSVYFLLDGITVSQSTDRYVYGVLDPVQKTDIQIAEMGSTLAAINSTLVALGTTGIASTVQMGSTLTALNNTLAAIGTSGVALGTSSVALGETAVAIGTTILGLIGTDLTLVTLINDKIGATTSTFGSTSVDPGTLFGFLKRAQEFNEGQQSFTKSSGAWSISTRGGTLFASKTLANSSTTVSRS